MNTIKKRALTLLVTITFAASTLIQYTPAAFAANVSTHVRIVGTDRTIWFGDVTTEGCTITDNTNVEHTFTQPVAICALDAAAKTGNFTYVAKDFGGSLGLFLHAIAEDTSASDFSTYWLYDVNGQGASVGISSYVLNNGDSLLFHFENPAADVNKRSVNDGITYLRSQQQTNGQISGFTGVSGWAAMTFAASGVNPATVSKGGSSLLEYLSANPSATGSPATDWERAILAITASDVSPYTFGGINYVQNLESFHNSSQIGVATQINDDIFGLLALVSAGSGASSNVKQNALNFILSQQEADGGFSWSTSGTSDVDTTSAALQALIAAQKAGMTATGLSNAITNGKNYLLSAQNSDGGFPYEKGDVSNTSTTAWATMALSSLGVTGTEINNAKAYIRGSQEENGSFKWQPSSTGETFTTSYAVHALTGKYWPVKTFSGSTPTPTQPVPTATPTLSPTAMPSPTVTPTVVQPSPTNTPTVIPSISPTPTVTPRPKPKDQFKQIMLLHRLRMQQIKEEQKRMMKMFQEQIRKEMQRLTQLLKAIKHR